MSVRQTRAQEKYSAACAACRQWAANVDPGVLRYAENDRVAKSYGIKPVDASKIIANACRERRL